MIGLGFWGPFYYSYYQEPPKTVQVIIKAPIVSYKLKSTKPEEFRYLSHAFVEHPKCGTAVGASNESMTPKTQRFDGPSNDATSIGSVYGSYRYAGYVYRRPT